MKRSILFYLLLHSFTIQGFGQTDSFDVFEMSAPVFKGPVQLFSQNIHFKKQQ
jgi:hypothetical protein